MTTTVQQSLTVRERELLDELRLVSGGPIGCKSFGVMDCRLLDGLCERGLVRVVGVPVVVVKAYVLEDSE